MGERRTISVTRLRTIINEEAKAQAVHKAKAQVSSAAGDLMDAINDFRKKATPKALHDTSQYLERLWALLDDINDAPGSYIDVPHAEPKRVSLRPVKGDG